jgi:hypothetical protein
MYFYEATNYPKIYIRTYWGAFNTKDNNRRTNIQQIYENRNNFIQQENIKGVPNGSIQCYSRYKANLFRLPRTLDCIYSCSFDHVELYLTNDNNIVIINSPYQADEHFLFKNGWENYNEMYFSGVKTYIKRISKEQLKMENKLNKNL